MARMPHQTSCLWKEVSRTGAALSETGAELCSGDPSAREAFGSSHGHEYISPYVAPPLLLQERQPHCQTACKLGYRKLLSEMCGRHTRNPLAAHIHAA